VLYASAQPDWLPIRPDLESSRIQGLQLKGEKTKGANKITWKALREEAQSAILRLRQSRRRSTAHA